jgi:hypothetical protein
MTRRAIDSQATAAAMIAHYVAIGAVVVEERNEAERLRKEVERSKPRLGLLGFTPLLKSRTSNTGGRSHKPKGLIVRNVTDTPPSRHSGGGAKGRGI